MGKKKKRRGAKSKSKKPMQAESADRHDLYQQSVQVADTEVAFLRRAYKNVYGTQPVLLREDFCGTAAVCAEWVKGSKRRRAMGVDLHKPTLDWGIEHNLGPLKNGQRSRVTLVQDDVRAVFGPKVDVIAACNFSYFIFRTREDLLEYFCAAKENLAEKGVMVLDIMGGHLNMSDEHEEETRDLDGFTYVWTQDYFNPINFHTRFHIHFRFDDGSELREAFTYDWRLWSIPEVRELLHEAGFRKTEVYWEGSDEGSLEGNGVFKRTENPDNDPAFVAYIAASK